MTRNTSVEAETGRIPCTVYQALASMIGPKGYVYSASIEDLILLMPTDASYRKSVAILNRVLHRDSAAAIRKTTLGDHMRLQGQKIRDEQRLVANEVLKNQPGMSPLGIAEDASLIPECIKSPHPLSEDVEAAGHAARVQEVVQAYNEGKEACDQIKKDSLLADTEINPDDCVYVSIDDVGVRHQKDSRIGDRKNGKVVENTVIHVHSREGKYIITAVGMAQAFTLLVAYLLHNGLLENRHLYFFSDGARNIRDHISSFFKPLCPYVHMLDWYHLEKRMTELLSMALRGSKDARHEIRYKLDRKLWAGNIDDAIEYLNSLDAKYIKNRVKLDEAIAYLNGKRSYVAAYALRGLLGYRNSSNPAEKANDLVVANRQKHNGMSWSYTGSGALATITAICLNGEATSWISNGAILFRPAQQMDVLEDAA